MGIEHIATLASAATAPRWRLLYICDLSPERLQLARDIAPHANAHAAIRDFDFATQA